MDAILLEKSSSKKKKREQFTINHLEIERSPVPISGPGFYKSSTSPRTPASSETRFGYALYVKEASYDVTEDDPNFSKNSYKHVSSSSKNSSSIHALYPSTRPSAKPPMNLETSSGKALSNKKKMDFFTQDDDNLTNLSSSNAGPVFCLSTNSEPSIGSETTPEQASDNNKKWNSVYGDRINSTKNLNSSFGSYSCPCPGHSLEASTSTITTTCMKPIDAKTSDGSATTSQSSCNSPQSDILDSSSSTTAPIKRHTGHDSRWEAIQLASSRDPPLGLGHFKLLKRLGYGDIGSVYLVELKGTGTHFAMKVMDRASIISRNKLIRAQTEREILSLLDHPFLPTLYSHFDTEKFYCLVMEYCSGGNLYSLRQKQPNKYFTEQAARFYASEVLLALEYLHMLGIVYRDLKPENVLVREAGHIMLSDFDLSLRCSVNPTLVKSSSVQGGSSDDLDVMLDRDKTVQGCIQPTAFLPRIIPKKNRKSKSDFGLGAGSLPELMAEPTNARSMSFVGTHEYLAPEIVRGEGHGSAVDWWMLGIFIYELIYGTTPFKGPGNRATLFNVVGQPLRFPEEPAASSSARDLIRGLLVKEPQRRIAYRRGATEIKQHPFFEGVNWALVRSMQAPHVPEPVEQFASKGTTNRKKKADTETGEATSKPSQSPYLNFEYF